MTQMSDKIKPNVYLINFSAKNTLQNTLSFRCLGGRSGRLLCFQYFCHNLLLLDEERPHNTTGAHEKRQ
jgi:hypothetical protein